MQSGPHRAFVYRTEDLAQPERRSRVLTAAGAFLDAKLDALPGSNAAEGRRSRDLYRQFRATAKLPDTMLDRIYDAPIISHFYTDEDIAGFRLRWSLHTSPPASAGGG